ncbi:uncharacterized protein AKAW2_31557S [Aspergillus luchuensis]|uniref:J domain-containing protein n=1 Tax=Aspergillus kawachii TaxID=1069201 RepID=A0A7R7ZXB8_ASPKA|nr:uncharacterized protein AKAW2_31557S [Aspergillus luchuensis]BCR98238.1 hypothetical protein AKAW2_31557S [Aspergillus luchuensis]
MSRKEKLPKRNVPRGTKDKTNENKFSPLQATEVSSSRRDADGDVQMHQSEEDAVEPHKRRGKHRQGYSLKQRATTTRIRNCGDKDYYGVLGLERTCDARDVRQAYRTLALLIHPDHNKYDDAEIAFKKVGQAYQVLSNSQERAAFDKQHDRYENKGSIDPHDLFGEEFADNASGDESSEAHSADEEDGPETPDHAVLEVYSEATTYVNIYLAAKDTSVVHEMREKINDLNRRIKEENRKHSRPENDFLIKIDLLTGVRNEYNKATDMVQDGTASGNQSETLRRIVSQFENARKGYGYPETWKLPSAIGNGDSNNNQRPGKTNDARRILGYLPHVDSQRTIFFVESQPNGIAMKRSQDIGYDATRLYLELPESQKKDVRYSQSRYGKDQRGNYDQILGWDCRVPSNMSPSDWEYRRALPPSYGLVRFHNGSADILSRTALRNVLGREAADREINTFYEQRNMAPPWAQMPSRGRLPGRSYAKIQGPSVADSAINGQQGIEPTVRVKRSKKSRYTGGSQGDENQQASSSVGERGGEGQGTTDTIQAVMETNRLQMQAITDALAQLTSRLAIMDQARNTLPG